MADNFNHKDISVNHELVSSKFHNKARAEGAYFTATKAMNCYKPLFNGDQLYNYDTFEENRISYSIEQWTNCEGELWDYKFLYETYDEDNDSEHEEDDFVAVDMSRGFEMVEEKELA